MSWDLQQQGDVWQLSGRLDRHNVTALFKRLELDLPAEMDLKALESCDSAGLSCLVHFRQRSLKTEQALCFTHLPKQLQQLAELYSVEALLSSNIKV